jgi:hypothetical protein
VPADLERTFDVFLSYASEDKDWAVRLKNALQASGLKVWLDSEQLLPGDLFAEGLERGIQASRAMAIIASARSLRSNWVKEEYYRALGLANARDRRLRIIPVLIDSAEPSGFLASRSWADFRDPARFHDNVALLGRGIRDEPPPDASTPDHVAHAPAEAKAVDELVYLDRALDRDRTVVRQLELARWIAPFAGLLAIAAMRTMFSDLPGRMSVAWLALGPLAIGLVGWGATARALALVKPNVTRLTSLKDGLELCRGVPGTGCPRLWTEFWRVVHRNAGLDEPPAGRILP